MGRALVSNQRWHEEVFVKGGARHLVVISNDANDVVPCFYIKVWDITVNRKVKDWDSFSDLVLHGNQTDQFGRLLNSFIDPHEYHSDGVCHPTMAAALEGLAQLKRGL